MSARRVHIADASDAGARLDAVLGARGLYASRSAAARAIEAERVLLNGEPALKRSVVATGDAIVYEVDEADAPTLLRGEPIPLDVRFEDDELMVISKQADLVCHPSADHVDGTLVNALIHHCGSEHLCNVQGDWDRLGIVHRLDRDTSGLMLVGKTDASGRALMEDIRQRSVDRRYLALVHGIMPLDTGMVDAPIARAAKERTRMAVREATSMRDAMTTFRVLKRFSASLGDDGYTLIDCKLFTGRTHQIRVHLEYARHPLVGDAVYTGGAPKTPAASLGLTRQFLHSFKLSFNHPTTGRRLSFVDNLPEDLREALARLDARSEGATEWGEEVFSELARAPRPCING